MVLFGVVLGFLTSLIISTVIIFVVTKIFGEKEGFGTAVLAAFYGATIFALVSYFIGIGWIATLVGGVTWLIALGSLYKIGWLKSFAIAIVIWMLAIIVNFM